MSWYQILLDAEQQAAGLMSRILEDLSDIWMTFDAPKGSAMFASKEVAGPCLLFFSPGAASLASGLIDKYNGHPCVKPQASEVAFLIGHDSDREDLL